MRTLFCGGHAKHPGYAVNESTAYAGNGHTKGKVKRTLSTTYSVIMECRADKCIAHLKDCLFQPMAIRIQAQAEHANSNAKRRNRRKRNRDRIQMSQREVSPQALQFNSALPSDVFSGLVPNFSSPAANVTHAAAVLEAPSATVPATFIALSSLRDVGPHLPVHNVDLGGRYMGITEDEAEHIDRTQLQYGGRSSEIGDATNYCPHCGAVTNMSIGEGVGGPQTPPVYAPPAPVQSFGFTQPPLSNPPNGSSVTGSFPALDVNQAKTSVSSLSLYNYSDFSTQLNFLTSAAACANSQNNAMNSIFPMGAPARFLPDSIPFRDSSGWPGSGSNEIIESYEYHIASGSQMNTGPQSMY
ncbi:hypothetical protein PHLGIDRAFT_15622 [Phlebiopsis gigantea 11061_1 CR5-6]|uniref:Uncharacterized protein n=1 Tax=Phlebiopsis gigantea (strain 11061_1 CR5-6) TaxID=745531 RepID=A0A0C3S5Z3_PHLG1|nr:hypothetical protein PHLGIDRAFT_15622 [Phlebiopsis gigantea 11061_1 CR5-6]